MASNGFLQLGTVDVLVATFHNFGVSDIAAGLWVLADASNPPATDFAGGIVLPTASGSVSDSLGVTVEIIKAGRSGRVRLQGISVCQATAAITYGASVSVSSVSLKLGWVTQSSGSSTAVCGIALTPAGASGDIIQVLHQLGNSN